MLRIEYSFYGKMLHVPQSVVEAVKFLRDLGRTVTAVKLIRDLIPQDQRPDLRDLRDFSIEIQKERRVASYRSDGIKYEIFRIDS